MRDIRSSIKLYTSFGPQIATYRLLHAVGNRVPQLSFNKPFNRKIEQYLWNNILDSAKFSPISSPLRNIEGDSPIWMLWWQGEDNTPDIVTACIKSIKQHAGNHPVIVLDQQNWSKYISLDAAQLNAFHSSEITLTHLSDLFRVELLKKYGGIWMDSTLYMVQSFDERLTSKPFWTTHIRHIPSSLKWSDSWSLSWSGYFMAAGPENPLFIFLSEALKQYWRTNDCLIDYLLLDRLIALAYQHYPVIRQEIDHVPVNNEGILTMQPRLGKPADEWHPYPSTQLYKLSWKSRYPETADERQTLYSRILSD